MKSHLTRIFPATLGLLVVIWSGCGWWGERTSFDDPRVIELVSAAERADRSSLGFSPISRQGQVVLNLGRWRRGDAELIITTPHTKRMMAFRKTPMGYEWMAELESQFGTKDYDSPDGRYREEITIAHQKEAEVYVGGFPTHRTWVSCQGDDKRLLLPHGRLELTDIRPILDEWVVQRGKL